jgi:hypothetical protein
MHHMSEFVSSKLGRVRARDIGELTVPQLVNLYNEMRRVTDVPVREFPSRDEAVAAILPLFPKGDGSHRLLVTEGDLQADGRRTKRFNLPCRFEPRRVNSGTKRARIVELLSREEGATFEECQKAGDWDYRQTYENIRLLHRYCGFGLREGEDRRIHLVTEPERSDS